MGIFDMTGGIIDYRHPSLLPSARESRLFSHDQHTADAQSYANIIAFLQSNQSRERGSGGGGRGRDNNDRTIINESLSGHQMNNPTRNYDHRNNNNNNHNNNNDERKQHISSSSLSSISDSIPLFGLEELSEADIDTDPFIDGFFHSHYILPSSPLVLSHPLASSSTINNNDNQHHNNNSGPIRHNRTRVTAGFSIGLSSSSPSTPLLPSSLIASPDINNNDDRFIEEELPVEFLQPPSSSPQPVIDYQTSISLLDGIQEFAAI